MTLNQILIAAANIALYLSIFLSNFIILSNLLKPCQRLLGI